jgi:hypothetical protein
MAYIDPSSWYSGQMPGVLASEEADPNLRGLWTLLQVLPSMPAAAQQMGLETLFQNRGQLGQLLGGESYWPGIYNEIGNARQNMLSQREAGTAPRAPGLIGAYNQMFSGLQNLKPVVQQINAAYPVDAANPQTPYAGADWLNSLAGLASSRAPKTAADWRDWNQDYNAVAQNVTNSGLGDYGSQLLEWFAPSKMPKVTSPAVSGRNLYQGGTSWWG